MPAATVVLTESNGISGSQVDTVGISNINFGSIDQPNLLPTGHRIIIGQFSYEKYIRIHVTNFGTNNNLYNFYFWKYSGAYVGGETLPSNWNESSFTVRNYNTPVFAISCPQCTTSSVPTSLPGTAGRTPFTGGQNVVLKNTGISDYMIMQTQTVDGSTPSGNGNTKAFTLRYDEN